MKRIFVLLLLLAILVACGGGNEETVAPAATEEITTAPTEAPDEEPTDVPAEAEPTVENGTTSEETPETVTESPTEESDPAGAELLMSGTDPETGLEINPSPILRGVEFIVRGNIISMNLTPQTTPEFVVKSPGGQNYRIRPQGVPDIYLADGSQLQAFEYRLGMLVQATVFIAADAPPTETLTSDDFMILDPDPQSN